MACLQVFQEELGSLNVVMQGLDETTRLLSATALERTQTLERELADARRANRMMGLRYAKAERMIGRLEMEAATGVTELSAARVWAAQAEAQQQQQVCTGRAALKKSADVRLGAAMRRAESILKHQLHGRLIRSHQQWRDGWLREKMGGAEAARVAAKEKEKRMRLELGLSMLDRSESTVMLELKTRYMGKWKYKTFHEASMDKLEVPRGPSLGPPQKLRHRLACGRNTEKSWNPLSRL